MRLRLPQGDDALPRAHYIAYAYPDRLYQFPTREEVLKMEEVVGTTFREYMASKGIKVISHGLPNERTQFPPRFFYQPLELE